jgi:hypothetical protein
LPVLKPALLSCIFDGLVFIPSMVKEELKGYFLTLSQKQSEELLILICHKLPDNIILNR